MDAAARTARKLHAHGGDRQVRLALKLLAFTFVQSGNYASRGGQKPTWMRLIGRYLPSE